MLDFEFKWRWGRVIWITALAAAIGYWTKHPAAGICLLGIIDIKFEDGLFSFGKDEVEEEVEDRSGETFGPGST